MNSCASPCRRHSICRLEISTANRRRTFRKRVRTRDMVLTRGGFRRYDQPDGRSVYVDDGMRDQRRCHGRPGWIDWNKTGPRGWTRDRKRINHEEAYSRTTLAPIGQRSFLAHAQRGDWHHHHIAGTYLCGMRKRGLGEGTTAVCRTVSKLTASQPCL